MLVKCGLMQGGVGAVTLVSLPPVGPAAGLAEAFLHGEMAVATFGLRRKRLIAGLIAAPSPPSVCLCFLLERVPIS